MLLMGCLVRIKNTNSERRDMKEISDTNQNKLEIERFRINSA